MNKAAQALGRLGGLAKSAAKTAAVRNALPQGEAIANARLIATSPDLLAFAQFVADGRAGNLEEMARALVAKATGN